MKPIYHDVVISFGDTLAQQADFAELTQFYDQAQVSHWLVHLLTYLQAQPNAWVHDDLLALDLPYELSLYITEPIEARALNLAYRGKDYATNILSYPANLPAEVADQLPQVPLGELVICHAVVAKQAAEQGKPLAAHVTHLMVHGMLHLLGFDHELGQAEQDEMERIEIAVLADLGVANPYELP